jgi:sortase A
MPGEAGNAVLSAHRDRHFGRLDELAVGDSALTIAGGRTVRWRLAARRVVDREAPALFTSHEPRLTLTTCWPVRYLGPAPDRLIVTLEPAP